MSLSYQSGQLIEQRDHVLYSGEPGRIEIIADPSGVNAATRWYVEEYGGGVLVSELKSFGTVFIRDPAHCDHLELVARHSTSPATTNAAT